jgi:hypothetical protein
VKLAVTKAYPVLILALYILHYFYHFCIYVRFYATTATDVPPDDEPVRSETCRSVVF